MKKSFFQKLKQFVVGQNPFAPIEKRILSLVTFIAFIVSIVGNLSNIILGFDKAVILFTFFGSVTLLLFFIAIRKSKDASKLSIAFFIFCEVIITLLFLGTDGYNGNTIFLAFVTFVITYFILPEKHKSLAFYSHTLLVSGLVWYQYIVPNSVIPYDNEFQRAIDFGVGSFTYYVLMFFFLRVVVHNYKFEQKRSHVKNDILNSLNKKLDEKNHEIVRQNALLKEAEHRYISIFNNSPNIMFIHQDLKILLMNDQGYEFLDLPKDEILGRPIFTFIPKEYHNEVQSRIESRQKLGHQEAYEVTLYNHKGNKKDFLASSVLFIINDTPAHIVTLTDISERKRAEEQKNKRLKLEHKLINFSNNLLSVNSFEKHTFDDLTAMLIEYFAVDRVIIGLSNNNNSTDIKFFTRALNTKSNDPENFKNLHSFLSSFIGYNESTDAMYISGGLYPELDGELKKLSYASYLLHLFSDKKNPGSYILLLANRGGIEWNEEDRSIIAIVNALISNSVNRINKHRELVFSEQQYRTIFESAGDAILIFEPHSETVLEVNQKALSLYGFSYHEFIGKSLKSISENVKRGEVQIAYTLANHSYNNFESVQYKKDGTPIHLLINAAIINFRDEEAILSINRDITEIKKSEQILRNNEERLRLVLESTNDGIWDWNEVTTKTYFSPTYYKMLGYEHNEFPATYENWKKLVHPDDLNIADNVRFEHPESEFYTTEFRMQCKNGDWIWIFNRAKVIERNAQGKPARIVGSHSDITLKKAYEQQLEYARILISQIIDSIPAAIISIDTEFRIRHTNSTAETMFADSHSASIALFERFPKLFTISSILEKAIFKNSKLHEVVVMHESDRKLSYYDVLVSPIQGIEQHLVIVITNITERRKLESLIVQSEKMHSVSSLAAGMAHELNNPLGTISQGCQNLIRRIDSRFVKNREIAQKLGVSLDVYDEYLKSRQILEIIESMKTAASRASDIISNMLKFSKRTDAVKTAFSIEKLFDLSLDLAYNDYDLKKKHDMMAIKIIKNIEPSLPQIMITVSEIEQVIFNLFRNSLQAFKEKEFGVNEQPTIWLRALMQDTCIQIEIEDNGPGIRPDIISHIFEPFYTTKEPGEGTGLGLSVCYTIICSNHGGQLFAESNFGKGAKFIIRLPLL